MDFPTTLQNWVQNQLKNHHIKVESKDFTRPWGGFYVLKDESLSAFVQAFFPELLDQIKPNQPWSPKILCVAPHQRLSWQYHHRRSEVWRVINGRVAVSRSPDDEQRPQEVFLEGDKIELQCGERHRLIGLSDWGIVAEIWQHSDADNLSDENDIVRVQDDFGR